MDKGKGVAATSRANGDRGIASRLRETGSTTTLDVLYFKGVEASAGARIATRGESTKPGVDSFN